MQVHAALVKAPGSAADVAKQSGSQLVTVDKAAAGEAIPTLGVSPEIDGALAAMKKDDVSQILVLPANRLAVVVLTDTIPPQPSRLSEVTDKIRDQLVEPAIAEHRRAEGEGSRRQDQGGREHG